MGRTETDREIAKRALVVDARSEKNNEDHSSECQ